MRRPRRSSTSGPSADGLRGEEIGRATTLATLTTQPERRYSLRRKKEGPASRPFPLLRSATAQRLLFEDELELEFEELLDELFEDELEEEFELEFEELLDELFELELPATRRRSPSCFASTLAGAARSIGASPRCA
jgi:hypothetical protein